MLVNNLDMKINFKKSCRLRTGPRYVNCANVVSLSDCCLSWVSELRYLGVNIVNSTSLKFSFEQAKQNFRLVEFTI